MEMLMQLKKKVTRQCQLTALLLDYFLGKSYFCSIILSSSCDRPSIFNFSDRIELLFVLILSSIPS